MHNFYQPGQCLPAGNILLFHCWTYGATLSTCNIDLVDYLIIVMYSYRYTLYILSINVFGAQPHFGCNRGQILWPRSSFTVTKEYKRKKGKLCSKSNSQRYIDTDTIIQAPYIG